MTAVTRMLHAIDRLDWDTMRECFTTDVRTDYTSLWGGEPATVATDDLIADWQRLAHGLHGTQHQTGPVIEDGGLLHTHVTAHHWLTGADGGDAWVVYGHYVAEMTDDRISALTLQLHYQDGNRKIPQLARERSVSDPPRGPIPAR
jgi:hypothetical protein